MKRTNPGAVQLFYWLRVQLRKPSRVALNITRKTYGVIVVREPNPEIARAVNQCAETVDRMLRTYRAVY